MARTALLFPVIIAFALAWSHVAAQDPPSERPTAEDTFAQGQRYLNGDGVEEDPQEAAFYFRIAADQGLAEAQKALADLYFSGNGLEENDEKALAWYSKAAAQGLASAQFQIGGIYYNGYGVAKDATEAVKWYRLAAEQGLAKAQNSLGVQYEFGDGVAKDTAEAVAWYRRAAEQGDVFGQANLALCYFNGEGTPKDEGKAAEWFRLAAEQGNSLSQSVLGDLYSNGQGVEQNKTEAAKWYRLAAEQGNKFSQLNLALLYIYGQGVERDSGEAIKLLQLSADQGLALSRAILGQMYDTGVGVLEDDEEAVRYYRKAAEDGNAMAKYHLGLMYDRGAGVSKDHAVAADWYRQADEQNSATAQFLLGISADLGEGVPQDRDEAMRLWKRAADNGDCAAQVKLADIFAQGDGVAVDLAESERLHKLASEHKPDDCLTAANLFYQRGDRRLATDCYTAAREGFERLLADFDETKHGDPWIPRGKLAFCLAREIDYLADSGDMEQADARTRDLSEVLSGLDGEALLPLVEHFEDEQWLFLQDVIVAQSARMRGVEDRHNEAEALSMLSLYMLSAMQDYVYPGGVYTRTMLEELLQQRNDETFAEYRFGLLSEAAFDVLESGNYALASSLADVTFNFPTDGWMANAPVDVLKMRLLSNSYRLEAVLELRDELLSSGDDFLRDWSDADLDTDDLLSVFLFGLNVLDIAEKQNPAFSQDVVAQMLKDLAMRLVNMSGDEQFIRRGVWRLSQLRGARLDYRYREASEKVLDAVDFLVASPIEDDPLSLTRISLFAAGCYEASDRPGDVDAAFATAKKALEYAEKAGEQRFAGFAARWAGLLSLPADAPSEVTASLWLQSAAACEANGEMAVAFSAYSDAAREFAAGADLKAATKAYAGALRVAPAIRNASLASRGGSSPGGDADGTALPVLLMSVSPRELFATLDFDAAKRLPMPMINAPSFHDLQGFVLAKWADTDGVCVLQNAPESIETARLLFLEAIVQAIHETEFLPAGAAGDENESASVQGECVFSNGFGIGRSRELLMWLASSADAREDVLAALMGGRSQPLVRQKVVNREISQALQTLPQSSPEMAGFLKSLASSVREVEVLVNREGSGRLSVEAAVTCATQQDAKVAEAALKSLAALLKTADAIAPFTDLAEAAPDAAAVSRQLADLVATAIADVEILREGESIALTFPVMEASEFRVTAEYLAASVEGAKRMARLFGHVNNVRQIGLAMIRHLSSNRSSVVPYSTSADGTPLLSWRVHLLPFLGDAETALYERFHLDEPWDSPHNRELIDLIPPVYVHPENADGDGETNTLLLTGPGSVWDRGQPTTMTDIESLSTTILAVTVDDDRAVAWTRPVDFRVTPGQAIDGLSQHSSRGATVLFADGATRHLSAQPAPEKLAPFITPENDIWEGEPTEDPLLLFDEERRDRERELVAPPAEDLQTLREAIDRYARARMKGRKFDSDEPDTFYPPQYSQDANGSPLLSWRVLLLPYLGRTDLYNKFHLDEPWDSSHNRALLKEMPHVFRHLESPADSTDTRFLLLTGDETAYETVVGPSMQVLENGGSEDLTAIAAVVPDALAVPWTKPEDFPYSGPQGLFKLMEEEDDRLLLMCDNDLEFYSVGYLSKATDPEVVRDLVSPQLLSPTIAQRLEAFGDLLEREVMIKDRPLGIMPAQAASRSGPFAAFEKKNALLSWRVQILPALGYRELYERFHLDEPWDSPHNASLVAEIPPVYRIPQQTSEPRSGLTPFVLFTGLGVVGDVMRPDAAFDRVAAVCGVASEDYEVIWTKPEDLPVSLSDIGRTLLSGQLRLLTGSEYADVPLEPADNVSTRFWSRDRSKTGYAVGFTALPNAELMPASLPVTLWQSLLDGQDDEPRTPWFLNDFDDERGDDRAPAPFAATRSLQNTPDGLEVMYRF